MKNVRKKILGASIIRLEILGELDRTRINIPLESVYLLKKTIKIR
jgi:hypothetical protein